MRGHNRANSVGGIALAESLGVFCWLASSRLGLVIIATALREVLQLNVAVAGMLNRAEYLRKNRGGKNTLLARWLCAFLKLPLVQLDARGVEKH